MKKHLTNFLWWFTFLENQNEQNNLIYLSGGRDEEKDQEGGLLRANQEESGMLQGRIIDKRG
jgi:hypothetical protein